MHMIRNILLHCMILGFVWYKNVQLFALYLSLHSPSPDMKGTLYKTSQIVVEPLDLGPWIFTNLSSSFPHWWEIWQLSTWKFRPNDPHFQVNNYTYRVTDSASGPILCILGICDLRSIHSRTRHCQYYAHYRYKRANLNCLASLLRPSWAVAEPGKRF